MKKTGKILAITFAITLLLNAIVLVGQAGLIRMKTNVQQQQNQGPPDVVYVDNDFNESTPGWGYDHFANMQDGVNAVADNGLVQIFAGTYIESITVNKPITLAGNNKSTVVLDSNDTYEDGILVQSNNVTITNITIMNYNSFTLGDGVRISDSSIQNAVLTNLNLLNNWHGIYLYSDSVPIQNIALNNIYSYDNSYGIRLIRTNKCIVSNCNFNSDGCGLAVDSSNNNLIQNNTFNNAFFGMVGFQLSHYIHKVNGNTANGKALLYYANQTNLLLDFEAGQIILVNCSNSHIRNLTLNDTPFGVYVAFSDNVNVSNNSFSNSAILLDKSKDSTIISNNIHDNDNTVGIGLAFSNNNKIISNAIYNHDYIGIHFYSSNNNVIKSNSIYNNGLGINLVTSSNNNTIYHNNLDNIQNANDDGDNIWDNGKQGNYWGDYREKYPKARRIWSKGIWDTPYDIPGGNNKDRYPLINEWAGSLTASMSVNQQSVQQSSQSQQMIVPQQQQTLTLLRGFLFNT